MPVQNWGSLALQGNVSHFLIQTTPHSTLHFLGSSASPDMMNSCQDNRRTDESWWGVGAVRIHRLINPYHPCSVYQAKFCWKTQAVITQVVKGVVDTVNHRGWWFTSRVMPKTLNPQKLPMCVFVALGKCVCQINVMTRTFSLKSLRSCLRVCMIWMCQHARSSPPLAPSL